MNRIMKSAMMAIKNYDTIILNPYLFDAKFFTLRFENRKVTSTSPSCLEAHAGFFRLSMKEKFTVTFLEKVVFHFINMC